MNNKLKAALLAGGALGLLLVITVLLSGFVRLAGCCSCLWPIAAGVLATMLYVKASPSRTSVGDGAIVGALAGLIGGLIYLFIGLPISYFMHGVEAMDMQIRQLSPDFPLSGLVLLIIGGIVLFFIYVVLAAIGGLIGIPIFEKRKGDVLPPPPSM